jgi:hypothetical protein
LLLGDVVTVLEPYPTTGLFPLSHHHRVSFTLSLPFLPLPSLAFRMLPLISLGHDIFAGFAVTLKTIRPVRMVERHIVSATFRTSLAYTGIFVHTG